MNEFENKEFLVKEQTDGETLAVYRKLHSGDVWIYVKKDEVDNLIKLLEQAKNAK